MPPKRYNPYRVKNYEVAKFRGITDPAELHNSGEAYASDMRNLESFKIRALSARSGQTKDDTYTSSIRAGGSFVTVKGLATGREIRSEIKTNNYTGRPRKLPWRTIVSPLELDGFGNPKVSYVCADIDKPEFAERQVGYDDHIVNDTNYLECFITTCTNLWDLLDDYSLVGYDKILANADVSTNLFDGLHQCYNIDDFDSTYQSANSLLSNLFPWGFVNPPRIIEPELPIECPDQVLLMDPDPDTPTTTIVMIVEEGYSDETIELLMTATIDSRALWRDVCSMKIILGDGKWIQTGEISNTSDFLCQTTGNIKRTVFIPDGIPVGTIVRGTVTYRALDEKVRRNIIVYFPRSVTNLSVFGSHTHNEAAKSLLIPGSFPDANDHVEPFISTALVPSDYNSVGQIQCSNGSWHQSVSGALNHTWKSGEYTEDGFSQVVTLPETGGGLLQGLYIWTQYQTKSHTGYSVSESMPTEYDRVFHQTGTYWRGDGDPNGERFASLLTGGFDSSYKHHEGFLEYGPGQPTATLIYGSAPVLDSPPNHLDVNGITDMVSTNQISNLRFLDMGPVIADPGIPDFSE